MRRTRLEAYGPSHRRGSERLWRSQRRREGADVYCDPSAGRTATGGWRASVQRFGGFLAGMVIPNIGAFIAWGLITAFFIPTGWIPNANLAQLVGPMIFFLLPILIGYTGG